MTTLAAQIRQRCAEAREAINTAWSVRDLSKAALLVSQVEELALMGAGTATLPDPVPSQKSAKKAAARTA